VETPGGESGNIEHTWGMYNKPAGCSTPAYRAPHKQTNNLAENPSGHVESTSIELHLSTNFHCVSITETVHLMNRSVFTLTCLWGAVCTCGVAVTSCNQRHLKRKSIGRMTTEEEKLKNMGLQFENQFRSNNIQPNRNIGKVMKRN
jgi:hypothetical protein